MAVIICSILAFLRKIYINFPAVYWTCFLERETLFFFRRLVATASLMAIGQLALSLVNVVIILNYTAQCQLVIHYMGSITRRIEEKSTHLQSIMKVYIAPKMKHLKSLYLYMSNIDLMQIKFIEREPVRTHFCLKVKLKCKVIKLTSFQDILDVKNTLGRMNSFLSLMVSLCIFTLLESVVIGIQKGYGTMFSCKLVFAISWYPDYLFPFGKLSAYASLFWEIWRKVSRGNGENHAFALNSHKSKWSAMPIVGDNERMQCFLIWNKFSSLLAVITSLIGHFLVFLVIVDCKRRILDILKLFILLFEFFRYDLLVYEWGKAISGSNSVQSIEYFYLVLGVVFPSIAGNLSFK